MWWKGKGRGWGGGPCGERDGDGRRCVDSEVNVRNARDFALTLNTCRSRLCYFAVVSEEGVGLAAGMFENTLLYWKRGRRRHVDGDRLRRTLSSFPQVEIRC